MTEARGRFRRDNLFLIAAVALPAAVAGLFLLATLIPRWTIPAPAYDLVFRASGPYDPGPVRVTVDFVVRDGQVDALVRPAAENTYPQRPALFLFDHRSQNVEPLTLELPDAVPEGESRTVTVDALAGRRVNAGATAPDGYTFTIRNSDSPGLVGDLFGMGRYEQRVALTKGARIVPLHLPSPYATWYGAPVAAVGWIAGEAAR
jgi:hypothetical protein